MIVKPKSRLPQTTLALAVIAAYSGAAAAQTQVPASGRTITPELQEIIVTERSMESTLPLELSRYGADLEILTAEQIRAHGFVDVSQALEMLVPGVFLSTQAGAFSYVNLSLQGSRTSDVLWTVDGVRINNRLYNGTSPADTLPSSMIERTEVLKGGHGLMYGTQAIAGVINVVTRSFSETPGGAVEIGAGSHGLLRVNGYGRGMLGDHKFVVWGSNDQTDGYEIYDAYQPGAAHRKRGYDVRSFGLKYGYDFTPDLSLTLMGIHTDARLDYPNVSNVSVNDRSEDIVSLRLDYTPSGQAQFFLKGYYHNWDTDYFTPPNPSLYWGYNDLGVSAATRLTPHQNFEYHLGYDFQTYKGSDDVLQIDGLREDVHAVYGQVRTTDSLFQDARFAAGLRHNRTGANSTVGNVSGLYDITDYLYVQGVIGTSFMLPSAENLYRVHCPNPGVSTCTHGNPNLEPEESLSFNLSVGGRLDVAERPLSWQLTGWNRRIDNLITTAPIDESMPNRPPPEFSRTFVNIPEEVRATGGEILLRGPITEALAFDLSYTYSKELARGSNQQISGRPRRSHKGSLSYVSQNGWPFGANVAYKYVGKTSTVVTDFGEQPYGDYVVVNLGAHVFLDGRGDNHRLNLRLENALDKTYATAVNSAVLSGSDPAERFLWRRLGPPRTLHMSYSYSF